MFSLLEFLLAALIAEISFVSAENVIVPGAAWTDTSGNIIQAHGAGILKVGKIFYWFGEDKAANSALFSAVSCYISSDLVNWSRQQDALTPISGTMISASNIVERPKVPLWLATANTPCGPYLYKGSWQPLDADSRDMGLFQDKSAYLLYASDNNQDFKISLLDSDYYNVTSVVSQLNGATLEAPGVVKEDNIYYLIASHTSGWNPNPNKFFSSSSLSGPWSSQADIAPADTNTYFSQNAFDLPLGSNAIYMGDRWRPDLLGSSQYIWYPLDWSTGSPQIVPADVWSVDFNAGTYTVASGQSYEAESGSLSGSAVILTGSSFSGGKAVGYLGNGGSVTISNVEGNGQGGQWIALYYTNADSTWRNTTVRSTVLVDQPNTGGENVVLSVPVKLNLREGANSLTFAIDQSNCAADLDKIVVYQQG
ncbi:hypothetical protein EW145_g443 [Phellinidium pouzarii]|uniref:CBM6 domain-containing protein n=1 Tax=Phellinidium pouzarii TaxID=167371 RepID=A0A4V3XE01_9AGAM|nr:hypothetical protein EW145_g443 [Phellinidium pouzarii]